MNVSPISAGVALSTVAIGMAFWQVSSIAGRAGAASVWQAGGFGWWPSAVLGVLLAYPVLAYLAALTWYLLRSPRTAKDWPDWVPVAVCTLLGYRLIPGAIPESPALLAICFLVASRLGQRRAFASTAIAVIGVAAGIWLAQPNIEPRRAWAPVEICDGTGSQHLEVIPVTTDGSGVVGWAPQLRRVTQVTNCRPTNTWVPSRTWFSYDDL